MALPVIKVDSETGSDSLASGAGPATALTGTAAATSADGLTVTLDGSPNLSGVATDGSHVIYLADATAGARNFGKITGKGASTVTVDVAFGLNLTGQSWAIGGTRASIGAASSKKLFDNNSAAGDAMPGWVVEMQSGHNEILSGTFQMRRSGNTTDGAIILRGVEDAAVSPLVTFSNNGVAFNFNNVTRVLVDNFEMRNTHATKTSSKAFMYTTVGGHVRRIRMDHATDRFWQFAEIYGATVENCFIKNTVTDAIKLNGSSSRPARVINCLIKNCGGSGIWVTAAGGPPLIMNNVIAGCGTGISYGNTVGGGLVAFNTILSNTGDGLSFTVAVDAFVENNIFSNNGGWGIYYGSGATLQGLAGVAHVRNNNFYANTAGAESLAHGVGNKTFDPAYTSPSGDDYSVGASLQGAGYPDDTLGNGYSSTRSYYDIGAAQRAPTGGSSYSRGRIVNA